MDVILQSGVDYTQEEIKDLKRIFKEHKGLYTVLSAGTTPYPVHKVVNLIVYLFYTGVMLYSLYLSILVRDISIASEMTFFIITVVCAIFCLIYFNSTRDAVQELIRKISMGIYHYGDTLDPETTKAIEDMRLKMQKRKIWLMNSVEILFNSFCFVCIVVFPILAGKFAKKPEIKAKYENLAAGWTFNSQAMLPAWFPYDTNGWPGWLFGTFSQYYIGVSVLFSLDGADIPFIGFAEECCHEIEVLNLTLRRSLQRARYVYRRKYDQEVRSYEDRKFHACLKECLNDSVRHHYAVNSFFGNILKRYSAVVFVVMMTGALMLCICGLIFFSKQVPTATKIAFLFYMIGGITHIFIYSFYGEKITTVSQENRESVYEMEWPMVSKTMLPYLLLLQCSTNTPLRLTAGGVIYCSFDTFGNIVSSAYSYFNLLSASANF